MEIIFSIFPAINFLIFMLFLDSFKLINYKTLSICLASGFICAGLAYLINTYFFAHAHITTRVYTAYASPFIEEILKIGLILFLIKQKKIGFVIDAAIYGFCVGTGFAVVENIYYFFTIETHNLFLWIARGVGTGIMHGGTTAVAAMIMLGVANRKDLTWITITISIVLAIAIHSIYNQFLFSPLATILFIIITIPTTMILLFQHHQKQINLWMDDEMNREINMLKIIKEGRFSETDVGEYILRIKENYSMERVVDMINFIQLYYELSIKAKSIRIQKEFGIETPHDPELTSKLTEFKQIKKDIGRSGYLVVKPILHLKQRDIWELSLLDKPNKKIPQ